LEGTFVINPMDFYSSVLASQLRATQCVLDAWITAAERVNDVVWRTARAHCHGEIDRAVQMCAARSPGEVVATARAHDAAASQRTTAGSAELLRTASDLGSSIMAAAQGYAEEAQVDAAEAAVEGRYSVPNAMALDPMRGVMQLWSDASRNMQKLMPGAAQQP
jgi:hypothetical protein